MAAPTPQPPPSFVKVFKQFKTLTDDMTNTLVGIKGDLALTHQARLRDEDEKGRVSM